MCKPREPYCGDEECSRIKRNTYMRRWSRTAKAKAARKKRETAPGFQKRRYQKRKKDPKHQEYMKKYLRSYERRDYVKKQRKVYWSLPENQKRYREYQREYQRKRCLSTPSSRSLRYHLSYLLEQQHGKCNGCATELVLDSRHTQVDHIVPVVKAGSSDVENLQALCSSCNGSKQAQDWEEWLEEKALG